MALRVGKYRMGMRKGINVGRVVAKVATAVLVLYVGGTILTEIGSVINGTSSAFYKGLTLIGWTVADSSGAATGYCTGVAENTVCDTSGSGILAVVGIIAIAAIVMEFVEFRLG